MTTDSRIGRRTENGTEWPRYYANGPLYIRNNNQAPTQVNLDDTHFYVLPIGVPSLPTDQHNELRTKLGLPPQTNEERFPNREAAIPPMAPEVTARLQREAEALSQEHGESVAKEFNVTKEAVDEKKSTATSDSKSDETEDKSTNKSNKK